ncbi:hypothetical protein EVAR_12493_1 [Eumeta japonica]|uniref:Uncharacterized protein n=1 Tax=Eumeta variegata TaxID=151549 RepID=A0A4C1TPM5_EUMVA|nr:hypothetical protein EVAR_12493_1 [Eumeta japonica]
MKVERHFMCREQQKPSKYQQFAVTESVCGRERNARGAPSLPPLSHIDLRARSYSTVLQFSFNYVKSVQNDIMNDLSIGYPRVRSRSFSLAHVEGAVRAGAGEGGMRPRLPRNAPLSVVSAPPTSTVV